MTLRRRRARTRRSRSGFVAAAILSTLAGVATGGAAVSVPPFTTTAKSGAGTAAGVALLERVRVASHPGFDRIVFEFRQGTSGYSVRYVPRVVHDGSGFPVRLAGRAFVEVVFHRAKIHRTSATSAIARAPRFRTLRQLKEAGDFEAVVSFGLGLRSRVGFRVFQLSGPGRVVIDVAH